ncbi:hypothetical protein CHS0354_035426 [Potamilus streckersoni]|uniref:Uncharacterized protein n=1 Tax=Potamilus streckersoni TaxID=2493646 RepID=A0AAE0TEV3_9BIVA|nr:hypothetical protein CHS0354_035426 [Potamilus streckersoni]
MFVIILPRPINILLLICLMFVCITLLLNILIAQFNNTYQKVQDKAKNLYELKREFIIRGWEKVQYGRDTGIETALANEVKIGVVTDAGVENLLILTPGGADEAAQPSTASLIADVVAVGYHHCMKQGYNRDCLERKKEIWTAIQPKDNQGIVKAPDGHI